MALPIITYSMGGLTLLASSEFGAENTFEGNTVDAAEVQVLSSPQYSYRANARYDLQILALSCP